MANALVFFGLLAIVGVCFPALLQVVGVTLPAARRAQVRLLSAPRGCIVVGGMLITVAALPLIVLWGSPSGPLQLAAWLILVLLLGGVTIGAAGLAGLIGERMRPSAGAATALGALALELAAFFPIIGWLLVFPLAVAASVGATVFALVPEGRPAPLPSTLTVVSDSGQ